MKKVFFSALITFQCLACETFLPKNDFKVPVTTLLNEVDETSFNQVIDQIKNLYNQITLDHQGELVLNGKWTDETVNAGTYRDGNKWVVNIYGGLARFPSMTKDGLALVICHEVGHHLGGTPKKLAEDQPKWSSTEGQADYFSTSKCLKRLWNNEKVKLSLVHPEVDKKCKTKICKRIAMAGLAVAKMNAAVSGNKSPDFMTVDTSVVQSTIEKHPAAQCRLDTYFQGALCTEDYNVDISDTDETIGACHPARGYEVGNRPLCWFKPSITY
ncbi:MAG: hypothetical protein AB7I27_19355 [Bacteriovoracaceae bacterium]